MFGPLHWVAVLRTDKGIQEVSEGDTPLYKLSADLAGLILVDKNDRPVFIQHLDPDDCIYYRRRVEMTPDGSVLDTAHVITIITPVDNARHSTLILESGIIHAIGEFHKHHRWFETLVPVDGEGCPVKGEKDEGSLDRTEF